MANKRRLYPIDKINEALKTMTLKEVAEKGLGISVYGLISWKNRHINETKSITWELKYPDSEYQEKYPWLLDNKKE